MSVGEEGGMSMGGDTSVKKGESVEDSMSMGGDKLVGGWYISGG